MKQPRTLSSAATCMLAAITIGVSGCTDWQPTTPAPSKELHATMNVNSVPTKARPEESHFDELASKAPSAGGMYLDNGALVVVVADPREDGQALAAVQELRQNKRIVVTGSVPMRVKRGKFTFRQLAFLRDSLFNTIFVQGVGVRSLDLDERANRVTLGLGEELGGMNLARDMSLRIAALGLDTSAVQYRVDRDDKLEYAAASFDATRGLFTTSWHLQGNWDTMVGGIQVASEHSFEFDGGSGWCTIGFVATRNGYPGVISASHCTGLYFDLDFVKLHQANPTREVASESADTRWYACGINYCRGSDAAFFALNDSIAGSVGLIAKPSYGLNVDPADPYFVITTVGDGGILGGTEINLVGRTSGWTTGAVVNTCVDHTLGGGVSGGYTTTCTDEGNYGSAGGDSGGPIFVITEAGNHVQLVGIHRGVEGSYKNFSPVSRIYNDLGGTFVAHHASSLGAPTLSGSVSTGTPVPSWSTVSGASTYYIYREWANYDAGTGSNGVEYIGSTSSTVWPDWSMSATSYSGSTIPGPHTHGYIAYYVYAQNALDWGQHSATKYWVLAP